MTYARHLWPLSSKGSVYNGHLRGSKTLTPFAERFAVEMSILGFFLPQGCRSLDSNTQHSACKANALTHCATATVKINCENIWINETVIYEFRWVFSTEEDGLHKSIMNKGPITQNNEVVDKRRNFFEDKHMYMYMTNLPFLCLYFKIRSSVHIIQFILFISLKR